MLFTAHCLIRNEEYFVRYAIHSVVRHVNKLIVFDTGSTDGTVKKVEELSREFPGKILFEKKGEADPERHTKLRQEMIGRTTTEWFMILDGDEVWTERGLGEAVRLMGNDRADCLIAPFYLCVGDLYHASWRGAYMIRGKKMHATPRFFRRTPGLHWEGSYNHDAIVDGDGRRVFEGDRVGFLKEKFWHVSHLTRSPNDEPVYSSGGNRQKKRRLTYFFIGKKIRESAPEVFGVEPSASTAPLSPVRSCRNFFSYL